MTFKQFILEKWVDTIPIGKDQVDIFKNPKREELDYDKGFGAGNTRHTVRGLMNIMNDDFYVWDAFQANHNWISTRAKWFHVGDYIPFAIHDGGIWLSWIDEFNLPKSRKFYELLLYNNMKLRKYCPYPIKHGISPL